MKIHRSHVVVIIYLDFRMRKVQHVFPKSYYPYKMQGACCRDKACLVLFFQPVEAAIFIF
jgi:hypothetical protein